MLIMNLDKASSGAWLVFTNIQICTRMFIILGGKNTKSHLIENVVVFKTDNVEQSPADAGSVLPYSLLCTGRQCKFWPFTEFVYVQIFAFGSVDVLVFLSEVCKDVN